MRKRLKRQLELPLDLVYQVLLRLPVKTLSRLRCVSKAWHDIISDPRFPKEYGRLSQQSPLLLVTKTGVDDRTRIKFITYNNQEHSQALLREFTSNSISTWPWPARFYPTQSCQGVVCFVSSLESSILLCNPSTEEIVILPERPEHEFGICVGFAFADSSQEFKVVRFFEHYDCEGVCYCQILTLGSRDGWRKATSPPYTPITDAPLPFLHGALHLMPDENHVHAQDDKYIAAFDVNTEEYKRIPLPEMYFRQVRSFVTSGFLRLAELRGLLCLMLDFFQTKKMVELWFLKDYCGGKWVKQYNIDLSMIPTFAWGHPIEMMADGCIWFKIFQKNKNGSEVLIYDTRMNCFVKDERDLTSCGILSYTESFLPLGTRGAHLAAPN